MPHILILLTLLFWNTSVCDLTVTENNHGLILSKTCNYPGELRVKIFDSDSNVVNQLIYRVQAYENMFFMDFSKFPADTYHVEVYYNLNKIESDFIKK